MEYVRGDLLTADCEAFVNTVNTVGVMGKGIALQFKKAYPHNFKQYAAACKNNALHIGDLLVVKEHILGGEKTIINFPTKTEWRQKSRYEYIEAGLQKLVEVIATHRITSIALPPLGCGNGGLDWEKVRQLIENYLGGLAGVRVLVYEPNDQIKALLKSQERPSSARLTPARAMLLYGLFVYESSGEYTTPFVANKIAYFLRRLGEPDLQRLQFVRHYYGPYSPKVTWVLHDLNGTYLKGIEDRNVGGFEELELCYDKIEEVKAYADTQLSAEQRDRLHQLTRIIKGFESPLAIEVLATVDFIQKDQPNATVDQIIEEVHNWSRRKSKLFNKEHLHIGIKHLESYKSHLRF